MVVAVAFSLSRYPVWQEVHPCVLKRAVAETGSDGEEVTPPI